MPDGEPLSAGSASPNPPVSSLTGDDRRLAFLLHLLASAPERQLTRGELNRKLHTKAAAGVGLAPNSASPLLDQCRHDGFVRAQVERCTTTYSLTETGTAHLDAVRSLLPEVKQTSARGRVIPPENDQIREYRTGYLLLQVLKAPHHALTELDANKHLDKYARQGLELYAATARQLRRELAAQGLLAVLGAGQAVRYAITAAGRIKLANAAFPADQEFTLDGRTLHALLEAAREIGKEFVPPVTPAQPPTRSELERAVLTGFEELLRERHAVGELVPIHEVRAEVRKRLGETAARHDIFDDVVLALWRAQKLGLTPITDHAKATPEQLQDAIPGVGETLFYLEPAHAPAVV